jgi:hypothetical protein
MKELAIMLEDSDESPWTQRRHESPPQFTQSACQEMGDTLNAAQIIAAVVVGTMYERRQDSIAWMWLGESVWLKREPGNRYDRNAIAVVRQSGRCIGYLNRYLAARLAPTMDAYGLPVLAVVTLLTGSYPQRGVTVRFAVPRDG